MKPDIRFEQIEHLLDDEAHFDRVLSAYHELYELYLAGVEFEPDAIADPQHPQCVNGLAIQRHPNSDHRTPRVALGLRLRHPTRSIRNRPAFPSEVQGIPVHTTVIGAITAARGQQAKLRPAAGGCSAHVVTGSTPSGTLGCAVTYGSKTGILSNWHVFVPQDGSTSSVILQPSPGDGGALTDQIGVTGPLVAVDFGSSASNEVDAAIGVVSDPSLVTAGIVQADGSAAALGAGSKTAVENLAVQKSGRTTGATTGKVSAVGVAVNVEYPGAKTGRFVNQIEVDDPASAFGRSGDSGSLVTESGTNIPVGLYFADNSQGSTRTSDFKSWINPIDKVLAALATPAGGAVSFKR
ncbi:chymotrypsin family serine protease [Maricaulis sp. CAU 1757]